MLRAVAGDQFVLEADDHRIITYKIGDLAKIEKDGAEVELTAFSSGDHLTVDSTADDNGFFTAVAVTFNAAGTSADRAAATRTWDLPDLRAQSKAAKRDPGDERPVLRRAGGSAVQAENTKSDSNADAKSPASATARNPAGAPPNETAAEPDRPATVERPADPTPDADDPGPPELRRGRPSRRPEKTASSDIAPPATAAGTATSSPSSDPAPVPVEASAAPQPQRAAFIPVEEDPVIRKAREAAATYGASLPNFFAKQAITRYESEGKSGWHALDIVTADVAYEDGNESYKNISVGGKSVKKSMEETGGTWSTGQFQGLLDEIFDPGTAATFRKGGQETLRGRATFIYKFDVKRENSRWRINAPSQLYFAAYRGSLWIDKETSRVLRLEMEARNMPLLFPFDKVESATDYDLIRLSSPQQFLLPVTAEVLDCQTGTSRCSRNRIEYRNYRKFGAESDITFDDKQ